MFTNAVVISSDFWPFWSWPFWFMAILDVTPVNLYTFLIALGLGLDCDSLLAICFCLVPFLRYYQLFPEV